ncbi:four-carbon acid sugar kinase family protein [Microlunatus speluncae]|uniref:four-carbon acid sugar kinase family protein n=1 Tax=Microlunatus speluncae TaxID=2594267 RepID=UPI00126660D3|nr:four-carbon acid sugar kinase family protein [Microlunatus speluncae]
MPLVGFYGDDFTGSVDALLQFRRAGLDGVLLTCPDDVAAGSDHEVVGLAGVSRSLPSDDLAAEVTPALTRLRALAPRVVQYKACSTVDSSPEVGSLGRVLELARQLFPPLPVPMIFAQPDFGRYTVFGQHFATDGDRTYRLDRHPTMAKHPVTPITEADLARLIRRQTWLPVDSLSWTDYPDPDRRAAMINSGDHAAVVCDAFLDEHLELVARTALDEPTRPRFMIGSGGLSLGLGRALRPSTSRSGAAAALPTSAEPATGRTVAISGSYSDRTREQIAAAVRAGWQELDLFESGVAERAATQHRAGTAVIVHSLSRELPAERNGEIAERLAEVADACVAAVPQTRLISCGGDTSGSVLRRAGVRELTIEAQPWGNVVLCRAGLADGRSYELILKGGQMGHAALFEDVRLGRARSS